MMDRTKLFVLSTLCLMLLFQPLSQASVQNGAHCFLQMKSDSLQRYQNQAQWCPLSLMQRAFSTNLLDPKEILDQNQSSSSGDSIRFTNASWYFAQRIQPTVDIMTKISILVKKHGLFPDESIFTVSLRKYSYTDLKTCTLDPSSLSDNGSWIECNFSYVPIDVNESYYIVCHLTSASEDAFVEWFYGVNNPYSRGRPYFSIDGREWKEYDVSNQKIDFCFQTRGIINHPPGQPQKPSGPTEGQYDKNYTYETMAADLETDGIYYLWDWGDGTQSSWVGPYASGIKCLAVHSWLVQGSYLVKVKAKDSWGFESSWSEELTIRMKKNRSFTIIDMILDQYQEASSFLL